MQHIFTSFGTQPYIGKQMQYKQMSHIFTELKSYSTTGFLGIFLNQLWEGMLFNATLSF